MNDARPAASLPEEILTHLQGVVWSMSWEGRALTYVSPSIEQLVGIPASFFTSETQRWTEVIHPDDLPGLVSTLGSLPERDAARLEHRFRLPDGMSRWVRNQFTLIRDEAGAPYRIDGLITDIHDEREAQEALRENEERFRDLFSHTRHIAVQGYGMDRTTLFWNKTSEEFYGFTAEEALGRDLLDLIIPDEMKDAVEADVLQMARTGRPIPSGELTLKRKDGSLVKVFSSHTVVERRNGVRELFCLDVDLSERERIETELREYQESLERANAELTRTTARAEELAAHAQAASKAKSQFLANMSHEIRTPMNGVIGMAGLILDTALDEDQRRYAETLRRSAQTLLGLINDILDFSKIESGRLELETLDFDLAAMVDDFAATMAWKAQEKGLELICGIDSRGPTLLRGDPGRLRQILTNLVGNALKFTQEGEVAVLIRRADVSRQADAMVDHHSTASPDNADDSVLLEFEVRDTGVGIPEARIPELFDKFMQVDASTTRRYGGSGLGLAISKELASLMDGEIGVESRLDEGSRFWFTARMGVQEAGARARPGRIGGAAGIRCLVVDDNATNREVLSHRLTSWGMEVVEAEDGPGALQHLFRASEAGEPFSLAIIDMMMPGMDGLAVGRVIRADRRLDALRLIMLTSLSGRGDGKGCLEIGYDSYLVKPIPHADLFSAVCKVLGLGGEDCREGRLRPPKAGEAAPEAREPVTLATRFRGRGRRILVVEDNQVNQMVAVGMLQKLGLSADVAGNGVEALAALRDLPYDLVLMDVQMPVMDGVDATQVIREGAEGIRNPQIPIIAMTAHAMSGDADRFIASGMDGYLAKPVSLDELVQAMDRWLPPRAPGR